MPLLLVDVDLELFVEVPVPEDLAATLAKQWARLGPPGSKDAFARRFAERVGQALVECLDWDLSPPTTAQVTFARAIAKQLGLHLPPEALRHRAAMNAFLSEHGDAMKRRNAAGRPPGP